MKTGNSRNTSRIQKYLRAAVCLLTVLFMMVHLVSGITGKERTNGFIGPASVDPISDPDGFSAVLYNNTNGLPTSEANAIAETKDGFIWIGSYGGLTRYDGNTFIRLDSTTGLTSVVNLFVDSEERLWVGTNDNGVAVLRKGDVQKWNEADGLPSAKVTGITEDIRGMMYIGTTAGVTMINSDGAINNIEDPRIAGSYVDGLRSGEDSNIYGVLSNGDLFMIRGSEVANYLSNGENEILNATAVLPDPIHSGLMYIGNAESKVYYGDFRKGFEKMWEVDISPLFNVMSMELIDNQLWICARNGIGMIENNEFHILENVPMNNSVGSMLMDYEGNMWFTSTRQGVMKLVPNQFLDVFERCGLEDAVVNSTCMFEDKLFIATDTKGLIVLNDAGTDTVNEIPLVSAVTASGEVLEEYDLLKMLEGCRVRSLIRDSRNGMWISTWGETGLLYYRDGSVTQYTKKDGLLSTHVRTVTEMTDGRYLVVNSGGVSVIENGVITRNYTREDGIENTEGLTVSYGLNGDIVLGSNGGGIYVINEDGVRTIGAEEGLTSGIVMRIKRDINDDRFWIVTSNSIAYMTADYKVTTIQKFPYSNNFDLYENSQGTMWVLSSNGIYVIPKETLLRNKEIEPIHYSMANGLPCITTSNSYSELTEDGDLYIAGSTGCAKVNIDEPLENITGLKISIPYIEADGERLYPEEETKVFKVSAETRKITIYCYVFNYSLTDPVVSYYLRGFEKTSESVMRSELGPVDYTNLPGGNYRFIMTVKDSLGHGEKVASVTIIKEEAFYETAWFYLFAIFFVITWAVVAARLYIRAKVRSLEKKHKEEAERQRLSTELQMANRIQNSILPHNFPAYPDRKDFDIYATMDPAKEVGGDFYDFFLIDEDHLCMVMADVSGKGVPAALFMMVSRTLLKNSATLGQSPAEILVKANETVCANNQQQMFITVWLGILELSTGKVVAANAGHEYPAVMKDGVFELIKDKHGLVIGAMEGIRYSEYEFVLKPGDKLFVYTDGVPEATNTEQQMFGIDRMLRALNAEGDVSVEDVLKNVRRAVDAFVQEAERFDDMTMMCVEYKGKQEPEEETPE